MSVTVVSGVAPTFMASSTIRVARWRHLVSRTGTAPLPSLHPLVSLLELDVSHCLLETTAGLGACTRLRKLNMRANRIGKIDDLGSLKNLHTLDLGDNLLERFDHVRCLGLNAALRSLTLRGNPVAAARNYRAWPDYGPRWGTFQSEVDHLKDWFDQRHAWIEACLDAYPDNPEDCRGE